MDSLCRTLLVVDNEPVRRELEWELRLVREMVELCEQEIHRHEAIDLPAFRQWMAVQCADLLSERKLVEEKIWSLRTRLGAIRGLARHGIRNEAEAFFWLREIENEVASIPPFVRRAWEDVSIGRPRRRHWTRRDDFGRSERSEGEEEWRDESSDEIADALGIDAEAWEGDADPVGSQLRAKCKSLYRGIARILHPDVAGVLSKGELELWYQAQRAYEEGDLVRLESILARCDRPGTRWLLLSELREMVAQGNERVAALRSVIGEMSGLPSWNLVLLSPREVEERLRRVRRELTQAIWQLKREAHAMEREYERIGQSAQRWMEKRRSGENGQLVLGLAE